MIDTDSARAELLTLAGLSYRGFSDPLRGRLHESLVRQGISRGLEELAPVAGRWDLVWGPVTSRVGADADSSAMYVVRGRAVTNRYVVAVRGTNPLSLTDWLFGDFAVDTLVSWPFAEDGSAISSSTALGLRTLLRAQSARPGQVDRLTGTVLDAILEATHPAATRVEEILRRIGAPLETPLDSAVAVLEATLRNIPSLAAAQDLPQQVGQRLSSVVRVPSSDLRVRPNVSSGSDGAQSLFDFVASETTRRGALEVIVTGHSKGGALATALALWLHDTRVARDGEPGWDGSGGSTVECVSFAGPTPGNGAFAARVDRELSGRHQRIANTNDAVTHAWQADQLRQVASLFGGRAAPLGPLFEVIAEATAPLDYRHASAGVVTFAGGVDPAQSLGRELIHQHLQAYLDRCGLSAQHIDTLALFVG